MLNQYQLIDVEKQVAYECRRYHVEQFIFLFHN